MPPALGVVEITRGVRLQVHRELMKVLGDLRVVVEALVVIDLPVAVDVTKTRDLVAAGDVDDIAHDLESEWLKHARRDAAPLQRSAILDAFAYAIDRPDVAHPGADGGAFSIGEKIESAEAHPRAVRVIVRHSDLVDLKRCVGSARRFDLRRHRLGPARWAAARECDEIRRGRRGFDGSSEIRRIVARRTPDRDLETKRRASSRQLESKVRAACDPARSGRIANERRKWIAARGRGRFPLTGDEYTAVAISGGIDELCARSRFSR